MSRSPSDKKEVRSYEQGWDAISRLIHQDGSWSGHERNTFYLNNGDGTFTDASGISGLAFPDDGRAFAMFDFDGDGDLDLALKSRTRPQLRILRNDVGNERRAITFSLEARSGNRDAIGARIQIKTATASRQKSVHSVSGYLSQSSRRVHFGLEGMGEIESVTIRWPGGRVQTLQGVPSNHLIRVIEGDDHFKVQPYRPAVDGAVTAVEKPLPAPPSGTWLLDPIPAPEFSLKDLDGRSYELTSLKGRRVFLNFWATWCAPCRSELLEFQKGFERLKADGVELLAVSVDEPPARAVVEAFKRRLGLKLPLLLATEEFVGMYNVLARNLYDHVADLAIPTSFLLDEQGRIVKTYRGAVALAEIRKDLTRIPHTAQERVALGLPFEGTTLGEEFVRNDFALANAFAEHGYPEQAERFFKRALEADTRSAKIYYNLGTLQLQQRELEQAAAAFRKALEIDPGFAEAQNNLGYVSAALSDYPTALEAYRQALKIRPHFAEAHNNLGSLLARTGNPQEAVASFEAAIAERPEFTEAHLNLSTALLETDRSAEAVQRLERALELAPSPQVYARLARHHLKMGNSTQARRVVREGLERWGQDKDLLALAAQMKPSTSR